MSVQKLAGRERSMFGSAAVIASGHAIGYALTFAAAPILSRLYSPEAFGVMSVFLALATATATVATLRFDQAIPLPKYDRTAASLAALAGYLAAAVGGTLLVAAALWQQPLSAWLRDWPLPEDCAALLAAAVVAMAVYQITSSWMVRAREFELLARMRIAYVVAALAVQLAVPLVLVAGPVGLISGQIAGFGLAGLLAAWYVRRTRARLRLHRTRPLSQVASEYRNYPLFDVWAALTSNVAVFGPAVLLAILFNVEVAGWFTLAHRLLAAPLTLLSNSFSRVYFAEAARIGTHDRAALRRLFADTLRRVVLLTLPPVAVAALAAPFSFAMIFGPEWRPAGLFFSLLAPLVLAYVWAFVLGPTLDVIRRQGLKLVREAGCLALIAFGIVGPRLLDWSAAQAIATMSALGTAGYLLAIAANWSAIADRRFADAPPSTRETRQRAA